LTTKKKKKGATTEPKFNLFSIFSIFFILFYFFFFVCFFVSVLFVQIGFCNSYFCFSTIIFIYMYIYVYILVFFFIFIFIFVKVNSNNYKIDIYNSFFLKNILTFFFILSLLFSIYKNLCIEF